jgi:hypothetical protein
MPRDISIPHMLMSRRGATGAWFRDVYRGEGASSE